MTAATQRRGVAAWRLISEELRREIADGTWPAGAKLPPEAELAARFGVHRNTLRQAMAALAAEELIVTRRGSGSFVTGQAVLLHRVGTRTRLSKSLAPDGARTPGELLDHALENEPPAVVHSRLEIDGPALRVETLRRVDGVAIARTTHWFSPEFAALPEAFTRTGSITRSLRELGIDDYVRASTVVGARIATAQESAEMDLPAGAVVLAVRAVDALPDGTPLQLQFTRFRADRIELDVEHGA